MRYKGLAVHTNGDIFAASQPSCFPRRHCVDMFFENPQGCGSCIAKTDCPISEGSRHPGDYACRTFKLGWLNKRPSAVFKRQMGVS